MIKMSKWQAGSDPKLKGHIHAGRQGIGEGTSVEFLFFEYSSNNNITFAFSRIV